jgi:signal transduction histidine kinase
MTMVAERADAVGHGRGFQTDEPPTQVLIVDDERDFLEILGRRLGMKGFIVSTATNGEDALKLVKERTFDVVVLDLKMPGMDGIETMRRIKQEHEDVQIIMLTGHATVRLSVEAMQEGAVDFLEKPVDIHLLIEKIRKSREITMRKRLQKRVAHSEKLASLGTLAAGVAHELNNPLTVIIGMTDLLIEKTAPDSEFHEILKTIERQGANARRIVEKLVAFSRPSEYNVMDIDLNAQINEVADMVKKTLSMYDIDLEMHLADHLPHIKGNPGEIQQVILNIITNSLYEMKTGGGRITVTTAPADGNGGALDAATGRPHCVKTVSIRISDTGPGIRREDRDRLFDPFFTTKKTGEGTGLGLFISYGIIKDHGGNISFETFTKDEIDAGGRAPIDAGGRAPSETPSTTFIITLPASADEKSANAIGETND